MLILEDMENTVKLHKVRMTEEQIEESYIEYVEEICNMGVR
jgi:hypothetical protein